MPYLQYVASMQLSQLEKDSLTLEILFVALDTISLLSGVLSSNAACKLLAIMPPTPPRTLRAIATSIEGIFGFFKIVSWPRSRLVEIQK